jgi:hypothetical protein
MIRTLIVATLLAPFSAQAQYTAPPRPMPSYYDGQPVDPRGYHDSYGTADTHHHVNQTPGSQGYGDEDAGPDGDGWQTPPPYARPDQVDQGKQDDARHRADRDHTSYLNHKRWPGRNAAPATADSYAAAHAEYQAELAYHAREMQAYRAEQSRYADRITRWRARTDACENGHRIACDGPE